MIHPLNKRNNFLSNRSFLVSEIYPAVFLFLYFFSCKPADPFFRLKPLLNIEHTGFISRDFLQVIVTVDLTKEELPINGLRSACKKDAYKLRDKITIDYLRKILDQNKISTKSFGAPTVATTAPPSTSIPMTTQPQDIQNTGKEKDQDSEKKSDEPKKGIASELFNDKNYQLTRGEFNWLLDEMFLYREDYSSPEKCTFVFRVIEKGLYKKVENTNLIIEEKGTL